MVMRKSNYLGIVFNSRNMYLTKPSATGKMWHLVNFKEPSLPYNFLIAKSNNICIHAFLKGMMWNANSLI